MVNLLIADDHAVVRKGLRLLFKQIPDMNIVDEAIDGEDALNKLRAQHVDIVLLTIFRPNIRRTLLHFLQIHMLFISVHVTLNSFSASPRASVRFQVYSNISYTILGNKMTSISRQRI